MNNLPKLVFATANAHKVEEIRSLLGADFNVVSLADIGCTEEIPETSSTLEGNALQKARWVKERYGFDCFADDTGLMVDALGGEPGVRSARYAAGIGHDSAANMALLLEKMKGATDRRARFMTAIALIEGEKEHIFRGTVEGEITDAPQGSGGFGYDPVFRPDGHEETFALMSAECKNAVSHRGRAVAALVDYLKKKKNK